MITAMDAVLSLVPNAKCAVSGDQIILWESQEAPPTDAEINAEVARLQALEPIRIAEANRRAAYIAEADPLFFKAQRGEATVQEWQDKVAEIKARYPKEAA
jgi:hypothetical protein